MSADAVTLPAGWAVREDVVGSYYRRSISYTGHVDVTPEGVYVVPFADVITQTCLVREFGDALIEAAALHAAIKDGAA